jgi:hypothetical protein
MNTTMNTIAFAALCAVSAATLAQGQAVSREQVIAERDAARSSGWIQAFTGEDSGSAYLSAQGFTSSRTRDQAMAEVAAARASGELGATVGEDSGAFFLASQSFTPMLSRAQVQQDVIAARAAGELGVMTGEDSGSFHMARQSPGNSVWMATSTPDPQSMEARQHQRLLAQRQGSVVPQRF